MVRNSAVAIATIMFVLAHALALPVSAEEKDRSLEAAAGFRRFEQQVKSEIGGVRGERLVEESELSLSLSGAHRIWRWFGLGVFARWDHGSRHAGRFEGLDDELRTVVEGEVGGRFDEFWAGPLVRFELDWFRASVGYGLFGLRADSGRTDLTAGGESTRALRTSRAVAWALTLDAAIPVAGPVRPLIRLEYRVRYYDRRGGDPLDDALVHGTQNFTPLIGAALAF